jgi:hypothetical protein
MTDKAYKRLVDITDQLFGSINMFSKQYEEIGIKDSEIDAGTSVSLFARLTLASALDSKIKIKIV